MPFTSLSLNLGELGAPELVGFTRREGGTFDGDPLRLFLKDRHSQGLTQDFFKFWFRIGHLLLAIAAAQIWMEHVSGRQIIVYRRNRRKTQFDSLSRGQEIEGALYARQKPEGPNIDLMNFKASRCTYLSKAATGPQSQCR
jgi:hypothetical protein